VVPAELPARRKKLGEHVMESKKLAQGRKLPVMVVAMAMALTVNGAFALALSGASTNGQRMYVAWYKSGGTMVAEASGELRKLCAKS
jgi:hypothetical protein